MTIYSVYATRWDDPHVIDLIPASSLQFSMPLSDHGECSFSATVEPGRSYWRQSVSPPMSGVLVARDGVPVWQGWVTAERQTGPRTFSFQCKEWGAFFQTTPAHWPEMDLSIANYVKAFNTNDHAIFREVVDQAQSNAGQDVKVTTTASAGLATSQLTITRWNPRSSADVFTELGDAEGGPEWYFGSSGTLDNPVRSLVLADRSGSVEAADVLMFVEDTPDASNHLSTPTIELIGGLFPAGTYVPAPGRRGGNVIAVSRTRDTSRSGTVAVAIGDGQDAAQRRWATTATSLITGGWPKMTRWFQHQGVSSPETLRRHANADLATIKGIATGYSLVSLDGDPDWTDIGRGSTMRVILDTDLYGARPYQFETRMLNLTVDVPDDGGAAQLTWDLAETLEST